VEASCYLIHHYKANMHVMNSNSKRHEEVWQDISDALAKEGYYFSHLQCEDKWKYLKKLYVDTVDKNKESGTAENVLTSKNFMKFMANHILSILLHLLLTEL